MTKLKYCYRIYGHETGEVHEVFARDNLKALIMVAGPDYPLPGGLSTRYTTEQVLTPEGWRITLLRYLPRGSYFRLVAADGRKPTPSRVYVREDYDHSAGKYECCYFDDINHWRLLKGIQRVTEDMTF